MPTEVEQRTKKRGSRTPALSHHQPVVIGSLFGLFTFCSFVLSFVFVLSSAFMFFCSSVAPFPSLLLPLIAVYPR